MTKIGYLATRLIGRGGCDDQEWKGIQAWKWLNEMYHYPVIPPRALSQGRAEAWQRREELPEQKKKEKEKQREARSAIRGKRAVQGRARSRARSRETSSERREQQREGRSRVRGLPSPLRVVLPHPLLPPPSTPPPPRHLKDLHGTYAQSPIYGIEEAKEGEEDSDWVDEEEEGGEKKGRGEGEGARNESGRTRLAREGVTGRSQHGQAKGAEPGLAEGPLPAQTTGTGGQGQG